MSPEWQAGVSGIALRRHFFQGDWIHSVVRWSIE